MTIWVGEIEEQSYIYDPSIQLPDCPHIFLWNPSSKEMEKFIADITRQSIKPLKNERIAAHHIAAYQDWHMLHGISWLEDEKKYYESRKAFEVNRKQESIEHVSEAERTRNLTIERHKNDLKNLGKEYRGVRFKRTDIKHRITHCYNCKESLNNLMDIECISCNWIICKCGACGCGYHK